MLVYIYAASRALEESWSEICPRDVQRTDEIQKAEAIFVMGGDGTMLRAVRSLSVYAKPFYGIHRGRRGFFMNPLSRNSWHEMRPKIHQWKLPVLAAQAQDHQGIKHNLTAMNEILLRRQGGQTACIAVKVETDISTFVEGDGLLLSTAMGSFAYNLSSGGPLLWPGLSVFVMTSICAYGWHRSPSFVIPDTKTIVWEVQSFQDRSVFLEADGLSVPNIERVTITCTQTITLWHQSSVEEHIAQKVQGLQGLPTASK